MSDVFVPIFPIVLIGRFEAIGSTVEGDDICDEKLRVVGAI